MYVFVEEDTTLYSGVYTHVVNIYVNYNTIIMAVVKILSRKTGSITINWGERFILLDRSMFSID